MAIKVEYVITEFDCTERFLLLTDSEYDQKAAAVKPFRTRREALTRRACRLRWVACRRRRTTNHCQRAARLKRRISRSQIRTIITIIIITTTNGPATSRPTCSPTIRGCSASRSSSRVSSSSRAARKHARTRGRSSMRACSSSCRSSTRTSRRTTSRRRRAPRFYSA